MTTLTQHAAVVAATKLILGSDFQEGVDIKTYVTKEQKSAITDEVTRMLAEGEAELSKEARAKYDDAKKLRSYTAGMVTNWFLKSKELNGNTKHEIKNPGSRAGSGDEKVKQMRALRAQLVAMGNDDAVAKIDEAIKARLAEIKAAASKFSFDKIDFSVFSDAERLEHAQRLQELGIDVSTIKGLEEFAVVESDSEAA